MAAKAGISAAFHQLDETPRVGYGQINANPKIVRGVRPFSGSDRKDFFQWLNDGDASGSTPLRTSLQAAGEYFKTDEPWRVDPTNHRSELIGCRQNYTILMTDGYWNGPDPRGIGNADRDSFSNTLADVAYHYWSNDLRNDLPDNVPGGPDSPTHQHMVTFGVGLGVTGTIEPEDGFAMAPNDSRWPNPKSGNDHHKIDDLLHAAVNSQGGFFSAADPQTFANELAEVLKDIMARSEGITSGGTDSTRLDFDSLIYNTYHDTEGWVGNVTAESFDGEKFYSASEEMPGHAERKIYTYDYSNGRALEFTASDLSVVEDEIMAGAFEDWDFEVNFADLINYLRGDDSREGSGDNDFRERHGPLGDIIGSELVYSGPGNEGWGAIGDDDGKYFDYIGKTKNDPRDCEEDSDLDCEGYDRYDTVFVGANDGMLHAFDGRNMKELFAYVPSMVHDKLYKLADPNYKHEFYVDGQLAVGDAYINDSWGTYLVGTLGAGGKGVFALDVTKPQDFTGSNVLWEIDGNDESSDFYGKLGYTFSQPAITRLGNGQWVAIFGNGYYSGGDTLDDAENDKASLFVVSLETGDLIREIELDSQPDTGLSGVSIWEDPNTRTFVRRVYAGDLKGTLWRVDFDESGKHEIRFDEGLFSDPEKRPITVSPTLGDNPAGGIMVYFGTGKMFDENDDLNTDVQAVFGVLDNNSPVDMESLSENNLNGALKTIESGAASDFGWYVDLKHGDERLGERVLHKIDLRFGVLVVSTSQPDADACSAGGVDRTYRLDPLSGAGEEVEAEGGGTVGREIVIIPPDPPGLEEEPERGIYNPDGGAPSPPDLDDYDVKEVGWCSKIALLKSGGEGSGYEVLGEICDGRNAWRELIEY